MIFKGLKRITSVCKDKFLSLLYTRKNFKNRIFETKENFIVKNTLINSNSQYGEDLVIDGIIGCKENGFYIDIGANDPEIFNNTKRFYDRGWSGINIEPNPVLFKKLLEQRIRDINLNIGIGSHSQIIPFFSVSADTLSSFNKDDAERNCKIYKEKIVETIDIQIHPLIQIFKEYKQSLNIDFLSIDVEGLEMEVLESNDWNLYRPHLILIEIAYNLDKIYSYLKENDYDLIFKNDTNGIFLDLKRAI